MPGQNENWQKFYQDAWALRSEKVKEFAADKSLDAFALIQKLMRHETRFKIAIDAHSKACQYIDQAENKSGKEILPTGRSMYEPSSFGEHFYFRPSYRSAVEFLLDYLSTERFDAIIELGAGYGKNLIDLFYFGGPRGIPYYAGEYSESGTELAGFLSTRTSDLKLIPFHFDHNQPDLSIVKEKGRIFVFTCHTIEQVKDLSPKFFEVVAAHAQEVVCIHFEPFGFQIESPATAKSTVSDEQEKFFKSREWNLNLANRLVEAHEKSLIQIRYLAKNVLSGAPENPTSLAIWTAPVKSPAPLPEIILPLG